MSSKIVYISVLFAAFSILFFLVLLPLLNNWGTRWKVKTKSTCTFKHTHSLIVLDEKKRLLRNEIHKFQHSLPITCNINDSIRFLLLSRSSHYSFFFFVNRHETAFWKRKEKQNRCKTIEDDFFLRRFSDYGKKIQSKKVSASLNVERREWSSSTSTIAALFV